MQINLTERLNSRVTTIETSLPQLFGATLARETPTDPGPASARSESETGAIRTRPKPECAICGRAGEALYSGLKDRLFGAPGEWSLKRCPGVACKLVWLDPIPIESDIGRAYAMYYTHPAAALKISRWLDLYYRANYRLKAIHLRTRFGDRGERRRAAAILTWLALGPYPPTRAMVEFPMRYLPRPQTGRILEIGFGNGRTIRQLSELGWAAEGLETDAITVDHAKRRGLKVSCGPLIDQHYPDEHFDAIVSNHVLEHVHEPRELLLEARRILRVGGRFIAATPNAAGWGHRMFGADWRGLEPPRHLQIFTPSAILALARGTGFEHSRCVGTSRGAALIWNLSWRQREQPASAAGCSIGAEPASRSLRALMVETLECMLAPLMPKIADELILIAQK
jgi:SAM-dependent methyltransferase